MTAANFCWKIRDKKTGLFWNGYKGGCVHPIGTRFRRPNSVQETLIRIYELGAEIPGNHDDWEIVYCELVEAEQRVQPLAQAVMGARINRHMHQTLTEIGCGYFTAYSGREIINDLYTRKVIGEWIGMAHLATGKTWKMVRTKLSSYNIEAGRLDKKPGGWALLQDPTVLMMLRTNDFFDAVVSFDDVMERVAIKLGCDVSEL